jgi:hypothetical protein
LPLLERAYRIFPDAEIASHWGEVTVGQRQAVGSTRAVGAVAVRAPDSKPLRDTIERLTGTKLEPREAEDDAESPHPDDTAGPICSPRPLHE